jgi:hypothetical protein
MIPFIINAVIIDRRDRGLQKTWGSDINIWMPTQGKIYAVASDSAVRD